MSSYGYTGFGQVMGVARSERPVFSGAATLVDGVEDVETALKAAELDWDVKLASLYVQHGASKIKVTDRKAVVRADTGDYLATVASRYQPIQNVQSFEWANALVPEGAKFVAAGSQNHGRRTFLAAELPGVFMAAGDEMKTYLVMRNSHDGTKSLQGFLTQVRLACTNQLSHLASSAANRVAVRHIADTAGRMEAAREVMQEALGVADEFTAFADRMAAIELDLGQMQSILEEVAPNRTRWQESILANVTGSSTLSDDQRTTGWGLYNAATEFLEWQRPAVTRESALTSVWDGPAAKATTRLRQLLVAR